MENRIDAGNYNIPLRPAPLRMNGDMSLPSFQQNRPMQPGRPAASILRPASTVAPHGTTSQSKRARKDRGPNWLAQEILTLIAAKRNMFFEDLDTVDGRDLMTPDNTKWIRISHEVMRAGFSPCVHDGPACKTKWNQLVPDYKRIADFFNRTGRNIPDYWELSADERKAEGLPRHFSEDIFRAIHEWYGTRPQIQPPHVRDLLASNDANYRPHEIGHQHDDQDHSEPDTEDPVDMGVSHATEGTGDNTPPQSPQMTTSAPSRTAGLSTPALSTPTLSTPALSMPALSTPAGTPRSRPFHVPIGVTPHVISSSDTSEYTLKQRPDNTGVKRKSFSGHNIIAEATKATGAVMAQRMQDIAESSRDLERSKIEVQLKLFSEQMEYQREKDRRLYENAVAANENARLSILKQSEMVNCLASLSSVLQRSMIMTNGHSFSSMPHAAAGDDIPTPMPSYTAAPMQTSTGNFGLSTEARLQGSTSIAATGAKNAGDSTLLETAPTDIN